MKKNKFKINFFFMCFVVSVQSSEQNMLLKQAEKKIAPISGEQAGPINFNISLGTVFNGNGSGAGNENKQISSNINFTIQSRSLLEVTLDEVRSLYSYGSQNKLAVAAIMSVIVLRHMFKILSLKYNTIVHKETWTSFFLNPYIDIDPCEAITEDFVNAEIGTQYRKALQECMQEKQNLHSFCRLFYVMRILGIGYLSPSYSNLFQQKTKLLSYIDKVIQTISSLIKKP